MGHPPRRPRHPCPRQGEYEIRDGEMVYADRAGAGHGDRTARSDPPANPPCAISARRSSPSTGPITGSTVPPGSPGSPI